MIADFTQGDILDALANLAGTAINAVDGIKTAGKISTFLLKNADNVGVYSSIIRFINKNCPDLMKYLGKTEGFLDASKQIAMIKDQKMTKFEYNEIVKSWAKAGIENLFESGSDTTRVGRWMSQGEYDKMLSTGKIQMSGDNKVHVANPADINAFGKEAPKGSLYVEFDFQNCIAQLTVSNSQYVPYQFVYFEAMAIDASDLEEITPIFCFYDDDTMQKVDVIGALDEALTFCSNYKGK